MRLLERVIRYHSESIVKSIREGKLKSEKQVSLALQHKIQKSRNVYMMKSKKHRLNKVKSKISRLRK